MRTIAQLQGCKSELNLILKQTHMISLRSLVREILAGASAMALVKFHSEILI